MALAAARPRPLAAGASGAARLPVLLVALLHGFAPMVKALPLAGVVSALHDDDDLPKSAQDASLWLYLGIAVALVLAGGVFAGLTIAYVALLPPVIVLPSHVTLV
jgi:metal transporter CNNM